MADNISSAQQTESNGPATSGLWRDINASASLGEFLNNFNASTSSATSGNVSIGDRIVGGSRNRTQFGILQILAIGGLGFVAYKLITNGGK